MEKTLRKMKNLKKLFFGREIIHALFLQVLENQVNGSGTASTYQKSLLSKFCWIYFVD
jgi:hypothetical protein